MEAVIGAIALLVAIVGWLVTYRLEKNKERETARTADEKAHIDLQLAQLYGPIYGLLLENDRVRQHVQSQFGRTTVFAGGSPLPKDEERVWIHHLENYFLPNNRKIVDLIRGNVHLLHGVEFPKSWLAFLDYAIGYELFHRQYRDLGSKYGFHCPENFPKEFQQDIVRSVSSLKKKQWELVGQDLPSPYRERGKTKPSAGAYGLPPAAQP